MAAIVAFPSDRRVGKIRRVAEVYQRRTTEKAKNAYWVIIIENMEAELRHLGFPEDTINLQLTAFARAVEIELLRAESRGTPPGAA